MVRSSDILLDVWEETPGADPEPAGGIIYLIRPGNASGSPRRSWRVLLGRMKPGGPCLACCHSTWPRISGRKLMDGWMDGVFVLFFSV